MAEKKTTGGPRVQVRFKNDKELARIRKAVEVLNNNTDYGTITFNSFVSGVAFREADRLLKEEY